MERDVEHEIVRIALDAVGVELSHDENLQESGLDSLSLVTVIVATEEHFGITFAAEDLNPKNIISLSDLVRITEKYI